MSGAGVIRAALSAALLVSCGGHDHPRGEIEGGTRPRSVHQERALLQARTYDALAAGEPGSKSILFGDLHVHSTYSIDAFVFSLPLFGGDGAHPPADACDVARYCSALDFFSLNDHAESLTPERWKATKESLRQCNARAGDPNDPDLVAFVGFEWTQVGSTPDTHYGHKNVIFRGLEEDELPTRPITSLPDDIMQRAPSRWLLQIPERILGTFGLGEYADFMWLVQRLADLPNCAHGVPAPELPDDCRENATTAGELFRKLDEWGFESLVIPHGLAWGIHAPPGARLDNQLNRIDHDPARQRLLEIYSGHGNGERYRPWGRDAGSEEVCSEPTANFLPCCWRAGEIVRSRCGDLTEAECDERVREARELALAAGVAPHLVLPDTRTEDWLDCDQCRDCFKPAFTLRPGTSAQYGAAISSFEEPEGSSPQRFRWGFIGSSDDHEGRPGTGYKQFERRRMADARGFAGPWSERALRPLIRGRQRDPQRAQAATRGARSFSGLLDVERVASFMYPGGLAAVHSRGRSRSAIWRALERREVYGTSGPRILLWFDLLNGPEGVAPMGSEVQLAGVPEFRVRAAGALVQRDGCPRSSLTGLSGERRERLCRGQCYHPGDRRHRITAIEVIRIRPQVHAGEPVGPLIEDPWRRFECAPNPAGCIVTFEDPEYSLAGRDALYYVRALQEPSPAVNGANYRTEFDASGRAVRTRPCHGSYETPESDDCLAPVQERAWSSPIFIDQL